MGVEKDKSPRLKCGFQFRSWRRTEGRDDRNAEIILEEHKAVLQFGRRDSLRQGQEGSVEIPDSKGNDGKNKIGQH